MTATGPIARAHPPPGRPSGGELGELLDVREGGHAIVGMLTDGADPVRKVSIIPRGLALDVTFAAPDSDRFNYREPEVEANRTTRREGPPARRDRDECVHASP
jgi:ATP-dependent Zn protease